MLTLLVSIPSLRAEPGPLRPKPVGPCVVSSPAHPAASGDFQRGIALGLHSADPDFDYGLFLDEIRQTRANWVSLFVPLQMKTIDGVEVAWTLGEAAQLDVLQRTTRQAHARGFKVLIFPVVLLENPQAGQWRGMLAPIDRRAWHGHYRRLILRLAEAAQGWGAEGLCVGSEFCSLERDTPQWRRTIAEVRRAYTGHLIYSANWDHYQAVAFWDALDAIAISGYYELSTDLDPEPHFQALLNEWVRHRDDLLAWRGSHHPDRPIVFSEVGYTDQDGCSIYPWNYTLLTRPDAQEQALCYRAFIEAWKDVDELCGVFFYNWWHEAASELAGGRAGSYSPYGKPAEQLIRQWYGQWHHGQWENPDLRGKSNE